MNKYLEKIASRERYVRKGIKTYKRHYTTIKTIKDESVKRVLDSTLDKKDFNKDD